MAKDWYVSSTNWATLAQFQTTHAYSVGDVIRPLSPSATTQFALKCTTAGTSGSTQPTWSSTSTTNAGTAVFTNVTGQAWSTPAGTLATITWQTSLNIAAGDRVFVSSDHSESGATNNYQMTGTGSLTPIKLISVNKSGSVPPVEADIQSGASITTSGEFEVDPFCPLFFDGFTFNSGASFRFANNGKTHSYFKNCAFVFNNSLTTSVFYSSDQTKITLDNTTVQFGNASQHIRGNSTYQLEVEWINTQSAIAGATIPTNLFNEDAANAPPLVVTARGVDLSAVTGTLVASTTSAGGGGTRALFEGCKINTSVTRYGTSSSNSVSNEEVELVNCFDGTNIINERYIPAGTVTTETSTYLSSGASDDVGNFSHKMVTTSFSENVVVPLTSFWLDVENTAVGSAVTATVEIVSSVSLNNTDIHLQLEYQGTSGSSVSSFIDSLSSPLAASSALPSSTATWNSPPSTPVYQKLQVTFTPEKAGRVRGRVLLGKPSTTVYVNPQILIQ